MRPIYSSVQDFVWNSVLNSVWIPAQKSVCGSVRRSTMDSVWDVWDSVQDSVKAPLRSAVDSYECGAINEIC